MTHPPAPLRRQPLLIAALLAQASCGGGDSTGNDTAAPAAYYSTMTYRDSQILALAVFEEGPVYGFYQSDYNVPERPEYVYAGFFVGVVSGALVRVMTKYPPPEAGLYVVRPPAAHPARKIRVLTELLIEHFG